MSLLTNAEIMGLLVEGVDDVLARGILVVGERTVHATCVGLNHPLINTSDFLDISSASLWGTLRNNGYDLFVTETDPMYLTILDVSYRGETEAFHIPQIFHYRMSWYSYQLFVEMTGPYPIPGYPFEELVEVHNWQEEGF